MKNRRLPTKRRSSPKGILKRLAAVTTRRKQRAATAAAEDMEMEDNSSRVSRALTIIFMIHIVAIGLIFFHQNFLDGRTSGEGESVAISRPPVISSPPTPVTRDAPRLSSGDTPYIVKTGDNYARIAAAHSIEEADLREANRDAEIRPNLILIIPPKRIVAVDPPELAARHDEPARERNDGLVEAVPVDVSNAPRAQVVRPNVTHESRPATAVATSGQTYVVQEGDTLWRISNRFKVSTDALQKANGISDPTRMRVGMTLKIPR